MADHQDKKPVVRRRRRSKTKPTKQSVVVKGKKGLSRDDLVKQLEADLPADASPAMKEAHLVSLQNDAFKKAKGKAVDVWYQLQNAKVVKKQRFEGGSVYSTYVGLEKNLTPQIKEWRAKGELR